MPFQLRPSSCQLAETVSIGMARSASFRQLIQRIGELKGIVYIEGRLVVRPESKRVLYGTLQHRILKAGEFRLLYVTVAPGREDDHVALMAHEFQHAIEVLESGDTSEGALDRLFERIGSEAGAWMFETEAAVRAQQTVARELGAARRHSSP